MAKRSYYPTLADLQYESRAKKIRNDRQSSLTKMMYSNVPRGMGPAGQPAINARIGYGSVARTRGGAVTGEMKYYDTVTSEAIAVIGTAWPAGAMQDPDTSLAIGAGAAVATPLCLFCPKQGTGMNQRIGKNCKLLKIKMNITIQYPKVATAVGQPDSSFVRLILVQDKQTNASQMNAAQLFGTAITGSQAILAYQNVDNFGRFKVLKDKWVTLAPPNVSHLANDTIGYPGYKRTMKISHRFMVPQEVRFNAANNGTIADIVDNSWHFIAVCSSNELGPTLTYYCRCSFKE